MMVDMSRYGKNTLKIFFPGTTRPIAIVKLCMKYQRPKPFIMCAVYDPGLALICFMARSNFATKAFTWENVTLIDSLEFITSCDQEFG